MEVDRPPNPASDRDGPDAEAVAAGAEVVGLPALANDLAMEASTAEAPAPETAPPGARDRGAHESGGLLRDGIEALAIAVLLSLVIKNFVVEAYKVPTGSMEPTIIGEEENGDRIIVSRLPYIIRDPRRWEVVVFQYPNNRTVNYIKRVIGLPNEALFILGGDIYTAPFGSETASFLDLWRSKKLTIERKPRAVQDMFFDEFPEIAPEHVRTIDLEILHRYWNVPAPVLGGEEIWKVVDGKVELETRTSSSIGFRQMTTDNREFAPPGVANRGGHNAVGDVRLDLVVTARKPGGWFTARINDTQHDHRLDLRLPVESEAADGGLWFDDERQAAISGFRLPVGKSVRVTFANADDALEVRIDGEIRARWLYTHEPVEKTEFKMPPVCTFGGERAALAFERLSVCRDVHYQGGGGRDTTGIIARADIPEGHYFVLGDNSPSSKDSREWVRITIQPPALGGERRLSGDAEAILDPQDLSTRNDNPWWDQKKKRRYFMDEFGGVYDITEGGMGARSSANSPFVPRRLITGRAFGVFLPWERKKIVR